MAVFSSPNAIAESALAFLAVSMTFLAILSITRRRIILFFSTVISPICYSLVFYIIGFALSAHPSSRNDESASLACSALLLVGLAKSIVSHSIPDGHKTLTASSYEQLLQMVFVLVLVLPPWSSGHRVLFGTLVAALFVLWVGQLKARMLSASACSRIKDDLLISEYMSRKHNANHDLESTDFQGLNYIVSGELSRRDSIRFLWKHVINFERRDSIRFFWKHVVNLAVELQRKRYIPDLGLGACIPGKILHPVIRYDTLVTIEDIWKHIESSECRDVCLSFALFKLLRRRFRGCFLHESRHDRTTQLLVRGLLSSQCQNPLRAFHIIEAELGFVFDFFFTCPLPDYLSTIAYTVLTGYAAYTTFFPSSYHVQKDEGISKAIVHRLISAIVLLFPVLGFLQLFWSLVSNWQTVNLVVNVCRRRKRSSSMRYTDRILLWMVRMYRGSNSIVVRMVNIYDSVVPVLRLHSTSRTRSYSPEIFWSNRARQYCLFHGDYRSFTTRHISNEAKGALLNALGCSGGNLSDGRCSLSRNEEHTLHWACDQEFVAEKILVWHIATTLCHVGQHAIQPKETRDNYQVATLLSDYCAYLVGFAPELIADNIYATRLVFDNGQVAAMERLEGEGSLARMYQSAAVMDLGGTDFAATAQHDVVFKGKMLAAQLIKLPDDIQWKVLAEFWAELMLFVSPSHNSAAHLERLKDGGELITHIWALLTHAGILERPCGRDDHTAAIQTNVGTSMPGEATTSGSAQTEIEVMIGSSSKEY